MTLSRLGTYENGLVLILSLGGAAAALDAQALFYLTPFVSDELQLNNARVGLLASIALLTWSISGYLIGALSDRSGVRKPYLVAAFSLFAVCSVLSGLANSFALLFAARMLMGVAEGPVIPVTQSIVMAASSPQRRGFNMGVAQNFGAQLMGSMFGPIIVVFLATRFNWHVAFYVAAIPGALVAILVALFVREPQIDRSREIRASRSLNSQLRTLLGVPNVRVCLVISTMIVGWYFLVLTFLPLYCVRVLHMTPERMSFVMSASGAAGVVSSLLVPYLSDRLGRRPTIALFALLGAIAVIAPMLAGQHYFLLVGLVLVGSMAVGTCPLFMGTVPLESTQPCDSAAAAGLIIGVGQTLGGFAGPSLAGMLADRYDLALPLWIACGATVIASLCALRLKETAPRKVAAQVHAAAVAT